MYSNYYMVPRYSTASTRSKVSTEVFFGNHSFDLPIVPANMETVIDEKLAFALAGQKYFYILHRFMSYERIRNFLYVCKENELLSSISIGVKESDHQFIRNLDIAPDYITIDIAHGHSLLMFSMLEQVKKYFPETFVIAGNVGSVWGIRDLKQWGADAVKIGIGPGKACLTKNNTGFYVHPADLLYDIRLNHLDLEFDLDIPIIADGGVEEYGDIAKAIALGADMVMIGGMLAGHEESPGKSTNGCKLYAGSTANNDIHVEGKSILVPKKGSIFETYDLIKQHLQSACSYAGGYQLEYLRSINVYTTTKREIL